MQTRRWVDPTQPQTLQIAVFLLYINAAFEVLALLQTAALVFLAWAAAGVASGYGIANERKWGYTLGVATAFVPFAFNLYYYRDILGPSALSLLFDVALVALLLHPQSREYRRIWFK